MKITLHKVLHRQLQIMSEQGKENGTSLFNQILFLDGAPTSICHFFLYMSLFPSVRRSVAHHISGTVHHLIKIFGTQM